MSLPPLAPIAALEARLGLEEGALEGVDEARALACLEDASADVREASGRDWVEEDEDEQLVITAPQILIRITLKAARRLYVNPDAEIAEGDGPFSRRLKEDEVGTSLLEDEIEICERYQPQPTSGLFTIATQRDSDTDTTIWYDDDFGCELFPLYDIRDVFFQ